MLMDHQVIQTKGCRHKKVSQFHKLIWLELFRDYSRLQISTSDEGPPAQDPKWKTSLISDSFGLM